MYAVIWVIFCLFFLSLIACGKRVPMNAPIIEEHETFSIRIIDANTFLVSVSTPKGEVDAKEYLCTKTYVCLREELPIHVYKIDRKRK